MVILVYIAHTKDGKTFQCEEECQLLKDHLINVSIYAQEKASYFDASEAGKIIGLLHDLGKYQSNFQKRIRGSKNRVDHSTAGAKLIQEKYEGFAFLYAMAISGHHTGLNNSGTNKSIGDGTFYARMNDYSGQPILYNKEIEIPDNIGHKVLNVHCEEYIAFSISTYVKMLYSCLVDADWTDTEEFISDIKRKSISFNPNDLFNKLISKIPLNDGSFINNIRAGILKNCLEEADGQQGLYTLTVPTGGGKTFSSLAFALKHAKKYNLRRIIYVIPYTSIIEQNADAISKCIGSENVLEHHSNISIDFDDENSDEYRRIKWACENWDIPVVITTNVQFFESFFSNKPSKSRKVHNISNTVIIFDEAQMIPKEHMSPCMYAISELILNYNVTAVLCSATQPEIGNYKYRNLQIKEIIENSSELFQKLKRIRYSIIGKKSNEEIIDLLKDRKQALIIVNSRKHAYALYTLAIQELKENIFHLSTLMSPAHRRKTLKDIKYRLKTKQEVFVISTQLIEAGVDIDFPVVFRSIAGIDSIIQAAGRANREGKLSYGEVLVFESTDENGKTPRSLQNTVSIGKEVIRLMGDKAFEPEGIVKYFRLLYQTTTDNDILDIKNILDEYEVFNSGIKLNFKTVSEKFKIIEDNTYNIIADIYNVEQELIKELRNNTYTNKTFRKLQQYTVSIYENEYKKLCNENVIEAFHCGLNILSNKEYYNKETGLDIFTNDNKNAECYVL